MREDDAGSLEGIDPGRLADAMLALPLHSAATLVTLEPGPTAARLVIARSGRVVGRFRVAPEVASAACGRVAVAAGLDPFARAGTVEGGANVARVRVRSREGGAELLVSLVARRDGLEAEVRNLSVNGRTPLVTRTVPLRRCTRCAAYQPAQRTTCEHDGAALVDVEDRPEPGGTIGSYLVGPVLGEGGDGIVFRGQHAIIDKPVAVKLLKVSYCDDPVAERRFLAEARAISRLRHPNVIEVTDYGLLSDGRPFTVMELVTGVSLYRRLHDGEPPDPALSLRLARGIALGLGAAHEAGVVHNDLKPSNVMLVERSGEGGAGEPVVKVLDFGASSRLGHTQDPERLQIFGTPLYMSPELVQGLPTDGRSDLYALGVVLFEMLTGKPPFDDGDPLEIMRKHAFAAVPTLERDGRPLPGPVARVVSRCLRKSPDERPQSAGELVAEIDTALQALGRPLWQRWLP